MQVRAIKTFRGIEGLVRRGDVLEVEEARGNALIRVRNVEVYDDKMAATPRNQMRRPADPKGMQAVNAGGLVTFGEDDGGNVDGATAAPNGSQTGEAVSLSSSPAAKAPATATLTSSDGRRLRGRRQS